MSASLLAQILVYLAAAALAAPLAKRAGLGSILGYLIAGVLIGPFVLGLAGDVEDVGHAAEFGVVILLFIIGLEMQPALLWRMKGAIFGVGLAQVAITGVLLTLAGLALGLEPRTAGVAGFILALSSTALVLQLLEERGLRRGTVGASAFGTLLFQDLAVIPLLAVLPLLGDGHGAEAGGHAASLLAHQPGWIQALGGLGAVAAVVAAGLFLTPPVFRIIARAELREAFTAFALLIVVGAALLMQAVGLSAALGAFLAGVVLSESEFRRELETDIEPFRGLLMGVFFIAVGAGVNLPLVASQPAVIFGLTAGLMALKFAGAFAAAKLFRLPTRDAATSAVALAQGGEFVFVLLTAAIAAALIDGALAGTLTAVVALSMAATPLLLSAWQRLSRPRVETQAPEDNAFEHEAPDAIVAGYGRFGQVVTRLLMAHGLKVSTLDVSVEQIALLKRFGRRTYYGDAARPDLLRAAGAAQARILVIAIDDKEKALQIVETAREMFPNLEVLARAFDRRHAYELLAKGAHVIERETFEGGLAMGAEALKALGWRAYRAERAARLFRRYDERMFEELRELWDDDERFVVAARESSPRMEDLLRADLQLQTHAHVLGADDDSDRRPL
ncbi:monovalent cation:proton antiporter-2 (CPA2) family protein [Brevundimonas sp. 2R-24]|uniref:Monovalent cation:proton antiporter-2 (CPA2) family protein n=1 Tax=Peiella sedimenti TaxID=3061083 RepID=A0ABT8SGZ4_9CAUL|nr:monovalent cation:proton antiporter-2 (CPA2) family protein [Caulobacteraceae bacterium XZ-24]